MRTLSLMFTLAALLVTPLLASAQDAEAEPAARERATRNAERTLGWMRDLDLSDSQKESVKKILIETELQTTQITDKQTARIGKLLTPAQKEKYDALVEQVKRWSRRNQGGQQRQQGQWDRLGLGADQLKEALGLSDEQVTKLKKTLEDAGATYLQKFQKMQQEGTMDWGKMISETLADVRGKIRAFLTDKQKTTFDELNKKVDGQIEQWLSMMGQRQNPGAARTPAPKAAAPETADAKIRRQVDAAVKILGCSQEEEAVFRPLIEKLVGYRVEAALELSNQGKAIATAAASGADEDTLGKQVSALARAREAYESKLALLEEGVRELLTRRQEFGLIGLEVLRPKKAE